MCFVDLSVIFVCLCLDTEKMSLVENPLVNNSKTKTFSHKVRNFNCISHLFSQKLTIFFNVLVRDDMSLIVLEPKIGFFFF